MRYHPRFLACCALALLALPSIAGAQTAPDLVTRRQLVEQALAAREAGDHDGALARFLQAGQIQMRPGLRMSIAQEEQALGRTLASCESASQCVVDVQADLASPESARVMQGCAALVASTCATMGRVQVQVAQPAPAELRVEVQGRAVALINGNATAYAEPGEVTVRATLGLREVFTRSALVQRGATTPVEVDVRPQPAPVGLEPRAQPAVASAVAPPSVRAETPHPATGPVVVSSSGITSQWWFWTGLSVLVVGGTLGGLAAGGVFDHTAAPVGGTAYTVNALIAR